MHKIAQELSTLIKSGPQQFFDTKHLKSDLKERSVRGGAVTLSSQVIKFIMQTCATIIMARLLTPQDYGLLAMVTAITVFADIFQEMGLSVATIQRAEINHSQISTLFWLNVAIGIALAVILAASAPIISWFYGEPLLSWITFALAGTFIISGMTVQHKALLTRQMSFTSLAMIDIVSVGIGLIAGISLAWYGARYWALVGMSATTALIRMNLVWVLCKWRPGLPDHRSGIFSMVAFGGQITGFDIVNYFARNFDKVLIGRFCGANVLGLYSKAYSLMMLPITQVRGPLNSVAIPTLSHIQYEPARFKNYYIKLITLIAVITMPVMSFLIVCADQVIYLLLGSQWSGAADIFKILCINAFVQPTIGTASLVLISLGQARRYLVLGTVNSIFTVISFFIGLPWGAIGVAVAYTICTYVILVPTLWYCYWYSPISITNFFSAIFRPVIASTIMGFAIYALHTCLADASYFTMIAYSLISGFLTYLVVLILLPGGLQLLREFSSYKTILFHGKA